MKETDFDFKKFIESSINSLIKPKEYFSTMKTDGGLVEPLIKGVIYGLIGGILSMLWFYLTPDPFLNPGKLIGISHLFLGVIGGVIGIFIGGLIILIISAICGGNTNYEANTRVAASLMVFYPIQAFFSISSGLNYYLGILLSFIISLYAIYVLYTAIITTLKGKESSAKTVGFVLGGFLIIMLIINIIVHMLAKTIIKHGEETLNKWAEELKESSENIEVENKTTAKPFNEQENLQDNKRNNKPEKFPTEACQRFKDKFSSSGDILSTEILQRLASATEAAKGYERTLTNEIEKILKENGFETNQDYATSIMSAIYGIQAFRGLMAVQAIIDSSEDEQRAAEMLLLDNASTDAVNQMLLIGKLTKNDMQTLYDNWELLIKIEQLTKK